MGTNLKCKVSIVIVYDTTCVKSFEDIDKFWFNEIESYADKDIKFLLLGNKSDIDDKKQVQTEKVSLCFYQIGPRVRLSQKNGLL